MLTRAFTFGMLSLILTALSSLLAMLLTVSMAPTLGQKVSGIIVAFQSGSNVL